ncbi:hypothetical protein ANAPH1_00714 [Anaplasma phagocytophilum]|nr:hypothetical protein ANAPH1_00714 [Anaplasma phagocytophilum]
MLSPKSLIAKAGEVMGMGKMREYTMHVGNTTASL